MATQKSAPEARVDQGEFVLALSEISREDLNRVGSKAATLGELLRSGFAVPEGYVLTTSTFRSFVRENELTQGEVGPSEDAIRIPADVSSALSTILQRLGGGMLAVRCSGVTEDLPSSSFAGQYETILGVKGRAELDDAVKRCWLSTFGSRAVEYRRARSESGTTDMALLVQKLVRADSAGVAFTVNPVTGAREVVVNAIRGLGDRLVSGSATPDEWVVSERATCVSRVENAISAEQAFEVAQLAKKVESHFGAPQDIEWAISGGKVFLLQARPITTKPGGWRADDKKTAPIPIPIVVPEGYWTLEKGHYYRPMSPMFASYGLEMINGWMSQMPKDIGLPFDGIELRLIGGRLYLRIVPPGGKDRRPPPEWLLRLLVRVVPSVRSQVKRMVEAVRTDFTGRYVEAWKNEWKPELIRRSNELLTVNLEALSDDQLDTHLSAVLEYARRAKEIHFRYLPLLRLMDVGDFAVACQDHLKWDNLRIFDLLAGLSEKNSEPSRRLAELVKLVREDQTLAAGVRDAIQSGKLDRVMPTNPSFAEKFTLYLRDFGAAALGYEVIGPTMAEMPLELLRLIEAQLAVNYNLSATSAELEKRRAAAEAEIDHSNLADEAKPQLKKSLIKARVAYALGSEETFYTQNLSDGITRYAVLEVGTRLTAKGVVEKRDDIFMLTIDEAREALRKGGNLKQLVNKRWGERAWAEANPGPASYGTPPPPPPPMNAFPVEVQKLMRSLMWTLGNLSLGKVTPEAGQLRGTPASHGSYEGVVRVIKDETEFNKLRPGDVLVCPSTAPSWSVIFSTVGALVTEAGGVLSHPAIIAREYRIPAVLSLEGATQKLKDGQKVRVDGDSGTVTLLT